MGAGHSAEGDAGPYASDPPASERRKHTRRRRHSVDSVASYSSQNHVDRIRTQNFSAASCQDDSDFGSIKTSLFRRSSSNLECSVKRPESVTSNTSSTRSRLRELVERKSSQDEHKSAANTVADIQYFENPTETLEFDSPRNSIDLKKNHEDRPKKRKLSKNKETSEKNKKQEKYQSKLADYYKLPVQLPQDEFYQHLTRSKAAEEFLQKRFSNSDTEFSGSYGRLCKHRDIEGPNLRRSRSLAVIREETFTDLQIQNNSKNKRSQLIPRARLFDKPCFKDRLPGRAKYHTKEEALEGIYIDSTVSCFAEINRSQPEDPVSFPASNEEPCQNENSACDESNHSKSVNGSWANLTEETKQINLSEDSIGHSRNPSEIDSLDSNYVRKHYNFEAHLKNCKEGTPDTERSIASPSSKEIYIDADGQGSDTEYETNAKTITISKDIISSSPASRAGNNKEVEDCKIDDHVTYDKISFDKKEIDVKNNNSRVDIYHSNTENKSCGDNHSIISENDGTISSAPDSITSYISISIESSTDKSHKLEYLAHSLAEKIDEYCDSQYKDNTSQKSITAHSENQQDIDPIYTTVQKKKTFADLQRESFAKKQNSFQDQNYSTKSETYVSRTYIDTGTYQIKEPCTSAKNITTEPFVTTLIENQYYSLPDINIGKCLRKSERIDAQLREEDPEETISGNTYEVAKSFQILCTNDSEDYGQLNKPIVSTSEPAQSISHSSFIYLPHYPDQQIQNSIKFEDDLKSIITIESSNPDDQSPDLYLDNQQNERELNEIEGTIRNTKLVQRSESPKKQSSYNTNRTDYKISKSVSNDNIPRTEKSKPKTNIKKHYSLRQRDPVDVISIPSPDSVTKSLQNPKRIFSKPSFAEELRNHSLISRVQSFKTSEHSNIDIIPLSGHQTLVIDPPLHQTTTTERKEDQKILKHLDAEFCTRSDTNQSQLSSNENLQTRNNLQETKQNVEQTNLNLKDSFITIKLNKVVKTNLQKLKAHTCDNINNQATINQAPSKLIIQDHKDYSLTKKFDTNTVMTRPQIIQIIDSKNKKSVEQEQPKQDEKLDAVNESRESGKINKNDNFQVKEKLDDAIKTDIEYQEKINSVKTYWSKLADKTSHDLNIPEKEENINMSNQQVLNNEETKPQIKDESILPEISVGKIIKTLESVKIVDSIRKISQSKLNLWKDESEKVKSDSEVEETLVEKIIKDNNIQQYYNPSEKQNKPNSKSDSDAYRDTPEIEIVELSSDDNQNQKTQATLIKAKGYEKGCEDFDHVRYKVMKSELFKNSMIANYRKEAQFDGLLQYLQDYSFQELLTNNNIVIIEPVRTKVEPTPRKEKNMDTCKIHPTSLKKNDSTQADKSKTPVKRHFFYHPIRVNKEIIEEELPNPDTVKKVRNLFEDTLKMKSPMTHDPPLIDENLGLTRRSTSYRNLSEEIKSNKGIGRKKIVRQLTIDTNFGNKKWDNASLSSGVSSGDLSSNNDYETEALSPYSGKNIRDNIYSSSDEYLCDSANQDFCCESQYVSPDILKKIRECGTSVTYYGGKVLNSKGSNVSPMTKAIMDEIKSLQRNCSTSCVSCQTKCKGERCSCIIPDKAKEFTSEKQSFVGDNTISSPTQPSHADNFTAFKFKLVKSNSCSSRLELTGTEENKNTRFRYRKQNSVEDPPLTNDEENSVRNKICRLESYNKGQMKSPMKYKINSDKKYHGNEKPQANEKTQAKDIEQNKTGAFNGQSKEQSVNTVRKNSNEYSKISMQDKSNDKCFDKKFYYVNDNIEHNKTVTTGKFGEMVFEEFEVLENCYDSLNSNKSYNNN